MLLLAEVDSIMQKGGCKWNLVWPDGSVGGKIVFTLLAEVVVLYVRPTTVDVRGSGLEFVSRSTFGGVEECLDDSIQVLLAILISTKILGNGKGGACKGPRGALGPASVSGPEKALGPVGASEGPSLFDPRGSLWSLSSDLLDEGGSVRALKAWLLRTGRPRPLTEVIFSKRAG